MPELAESWQVSQDGLTWTFKIRQGSVRRPAAHGRRRRLHLQPHHEGDVRADQLPYTDNIKTVTATDDSTLVMVTKKPSPTMLRIAIPILPEHVWKNISAKEVETFENDKNAVGSGPFILEERKTRALRGRRPLPDRGGADPARPRRAPRRLLPD